MPSETIVTRENSPLEKGSLHNSMRNANLNKIVSITFCLMVFISGVLPCYAQEETEWDKMVRECGVHLSEDGAGEDYKIDVKRAELTYDVDIESFDVSEDRIVIVFSDWTIGIFDKGMNLKGSFDQGFPETICGVMIHNDNIVLFHTRNDYATEINQEGEFVALYWAPRENARHIDDYAFSSLRKTSKDSYYMAYDIRSDPEQESANHNGAPYLIREDETGKKEVLYDSYICHKRRLVKLVILSVIFLFSVGLFALAFITSIAREIERGEYESPEDLIRTLKILNAMNHDDSESDVPYIEIPAPRERTNMTESFYMSFLKVVDINSKIFCIVGAVLFLSLIVMAFTIGVKIYAVISSAIVTVALLVWVWIYLNKKHETIDYYGRIRAFLLILSGTISMSIIFLVISWK